MGKRRPSGSRNHPTEPVTHWIIDFNGVRGKRCTVLPLWVACDGGRHTNLQQCVSSCLPTTQVELLQASRRKSTLTSPTKSSTSGRGNHYQPPVHPTGYTHTPSIRSYPSAPQRSPRSPKGSVSPVTQRMGTLRSFSARMGDVPSSGGPDKMSRPNLPRSRNAVEGDRSKWHHEEQAHQPSHLFVGASPIYWGRYLAICTEQS
jgi:hypothetical protein